MKQITVFGATGRSGQIMTRLLLDKGYEVKVLVRDPSKLKIESHHLLIVQGSVQQKELIHKAIEGSEAVVSLLGHVKGSMPFFQTEAMKNIIGVMTQENISRLVVLTGSGVEVSGDIKTFGNKMLTAIIKTVASNRFNDGEGQSKVIRASSLDYTIVRAPLLTMEKPKGIFKTGHLKLGFFSRISRYDVANFILNCIEKQYFIKEAPQISD
jgi:putative NADH-flavin reductase